MIRKKGYLVINESGLFFGCFNKKRPLAHSRCTTDPTLATRLDTLEAANDVLTKMEIIGERGMLKEVYYLVKESEEVWQK